MAARHAHQSCVHTRSGHLFFPVPLNGVFGINENSRWFPQKHFAGALGFTDLLGSIPVDSLAIFSSSTGESPLSRWRRRRSALGTSHEPHVRLTTFHHCYGCVLLRDEGHLPEVTGEWPRTNVIEMNWVPRPRCLRAGLFLSSLSATDNSAQDNQIFSA